MTHLKTFKTNFNLHYS